MGLLDMIDTESDGLIPLSIRYMFDKLKSMRNYFICVSMVQVYKEDAFDLLNSKKGPATIREDPVSKIFFIPGLVIVPVEDENQATDLVNVGLQLRTMAPQSLNPTSSRSHFIITFYLKKMVSPDSEVVVSKLTFADLAGNENVGKSDSKGLRLEEAKSINSSLCSLSDAICRLKNNNDTYLFRSSKLTKILQCSLMGHSYICILGMVRRSANFISETLSTLKFVIKCRQIKMSDPPQCLYSDIQDDLHVYLSHNQKSVEKSQRKVNTSEQDIPEHEFPSEEFREFTNFLGKCLISLSRMVKKIIQEVRPRQEAFIPHHITDESYIDGQEDNCLEEGIYKLILGMEAVPEEMLDELSQAEGIPEVLVTFQSSFKILVEQLRQLSNRSEKLAVENQEVNQKLKSENQGKALAQYSSFKTTFTLHIGKLVSQMLISKFESLTMKGAKDNQQMISILGHYFENNIWDHLEDVLDSLKPVIGDQATSSLLIAIKELVSQLIQRISGGQSKTSDSPMISSTTQQAATQTEEGAYRPRVESMARSTQCQAIAQSVKSQYSQVEDTISQRKIELLMIANKKMNDQVKSLKDDLTSSQNDTRTATNKAAMHQSTIDELTQQLDNERLMTDDLKQHTGMLKNEIVKLKRQNEMIDSLKESVENEGKLRAEVDRFRDNYNLLQSQLRDLSQQAKVDGDTLRRQFDIAAGELEVERSANGQLQGQLSAELQTVYDLRRRLESMADQNDELRSNVAEMSKMVNELQADVDTAKTERDTARLRIEEVIADTEGRYLSQASKAQAEYQQTIEELEKSLIQASSELASQTENHSERLAQEASKMDQVLAEVDDKDSVIRELQATNNVLLDNVADLTNELNRLKTEFSALRKKTETEVSSYPKLEQELKSLKNQLSEKNYRIRDLEMENNQYKQAKTSRELVSQLKADVEDLRTRLKERDDQIAGFKDESEETFRLQDEQLAKITELAEEEKSRLVAEKKLLSKELENLKSIIKEKENLMKSQIENYEKRISSLSSEHDEEEDLRSKLDELQQLLGSKEAEIISTNTQCELATNSKAGLCEQLRESNTSCSKLEATVKELVDENKRLADSLRSVLERLEQKTNFAESLQEQNGRLAEENQMTKSQLSRLEVTLKNHELQINELDSTKSSKDSAIENLEAIKKILAEKEELLTTTQNKFNERNNLLKKANEEYHTLEKEAIELRQLKSKLLDASIQLPKIKEDLQNKKNTIIELQDDLTKLKNISQEKEKEAEAAIELVKKSLEDSKMKLDEITKQNRLEKDQLEKAFNKKKAELEADERKKLAELEGKLNAEINRKDLKIQQLVKDTESQNISLAGEKNQIIEQLQRKIDEQEETFKSKYETLITSSDESVKKLQSEAELLSKKINIEVADSQKYKSKVEMELKQKSEKIVNVEKTIELMKTDLEIKSQEYEVIKNREGELIDSLSQCKKAIDGLMNANQVLTNNLKAMKKSQSYAQRGTSNPKPETSLANVPPTAPLSYNQKIIITSSHDRRVESNLITNFDKHLTNNTSEKSHPNPIAQYLHNKENSDTSNFRPQRLSAGSGSIRKYTREEYEKVLAERQQAGDHSEQSSNLLKPSGSTSIIGSKLPPASRSPSKPLGLLSGSLGGLHQFADDPHIDQDYKADDAAKGYSSRYSRNSRTSRNSRRSPTPNKEGHSSVH